MKCPHCTRPDCLPQAAVGNIQRYHEPLRVACVHCKAPLYVEEVRTLTVSKSNTQNTEDDFGTIFKKPKQDEAGKIADLCSEAYSFDSWGREGFRAVAQHLLDQKVSRRHIIGVLFSKHMRWAADNSDEVWGQRTVKSWLDYNGRFPMSKKEMEELCWEGMPA